MIVIGLTGSIGMGKSVAAALIRRVLKIPVHDSDAVVHRLMGPGGAAVPAIAKVFPGVVGVDGVDRQTLGARVFAEPDALRRLEAILHPRVRSVTRTWIGHQRRLRRSVVVLDIPLLFETGGEAMCDAVIVVSAPAFLQRQRVLRRPGMTEAKLRGILAQQAPDSVKRRRADRVISSGLGRGVTAKALITAIRKLRGGRSRRRLTAGNM